MRRQCEVQIVLELRGCGERGLRRLERLQDVPWHIEQVERPLPSDDDGSGHRPLVVEAVVLEAVEGSTVDAQEREPALLLHHDSLGRKTRELDRHTSRARG